MMNDSLPWRCARRVGLTLLLLFCATRQAYAELPPDPAAHIRHFEAARVGEARRSAGDGLTLVVESLGRRFELALEPSPIVSPESRVHWVRDGEIVTEPAPPIFYQGHVVGEADSAVALTVTDKTLDGLVRTHDEVFVFAPAAKMLGEHESGTVAYRSTDTSLTLPPDACGVSDEATLPPVAGGKDAGGGSARAIVPTLRQLRISLVADRELFAELGAGAATYMLGIINQVDAIYRRDHGVTLQVGPTVVFSALGDPFSNTSHPEALLDELADYRSGAGGNLTASGITHLFTGRDLSGSTVGIAALGALCDRYWSVGLSEHFTDNSYLLTLLTAHEIGHNFGAEHDGARGGACENAPFGFAMWPSLGTDIAQEFSQCSRNSVDAYVEHADCVEEIAVPSCGNGELDLPEQCDDGDTSYTAGDLCRADCTRVSCGEPTDAGPSGPLASDALYILRRAVGRESCDPRVCDVNGDGTINTSDALRTLGVAVGRAGVSLDCDG